MHILEITWSSQTIFLFILGLALAYIAHTRSNYIVIMVLVLHMGIEWTEWSHEIQSPTQIVFNGIHAAMDFIFLSHELRVHAKQYRKLVIFSVAGLLVIIFISGHYVSMGTQIIHGFEPFVVGGVLGCIFSHLYFTIIKK